MAKNLVNPIVAQQRAVWRCNGEWHGCFVKSVGPVSTRQRASISLDFPLDGDTEYLVGIDELYHKRPA